MVHVHPAEHHLSCPAPEEFFAAVAEAEAAGHIVAVG